MISQAKKFFALDQPLQSAPFSFSCLNFMSHSVTVRPSGRSFSVEQNETVLAAALRQGITLPYGCQDGACGSCKGKVISGQVVHGAHSPTALSAEEEKSGQALFCCAVPQSALEIEAREVSLGDFPAKKLAARVASITRPSSDVAIVHLQLPASEKAQYHAGQYLQFILKDGSRRSYSMANAAHLAEKIELHIRHMPGGKFTDTLFGLAEPALKERDILRVEMPLGTFFIREESSKPMVLLASGTGFAPIKAMLEHAIEKKNARPMVLYWGARRKADLYLHDTALALAAQAQAAGLNVRYVPVLSEPSADDAWSGRTGLVHQAVMADLPDLSGCQVYACGAPVMVQAARTDFTTRCGLPPEEFYADAFTSAADGVN